MKRSAKLFVSLLLVSSSAFAAEYTIDPDHTTVGFHVRHLGISNVKGKLLKVSGVFDYDPSNVPASKTSVSIDAGSIDTSHRKRDDHLKSEDFLSVSKFPSISFNSKEVTDVKESGFKVIGDLSIRGVTKLVTLDITPSGVAKDPWGNERAAFSAIATINRKDYGIVWNKVMDTGGLVVGEEVKIEIEIEGIKKA